VIVDVLSHHFDEVGSLFCLSLPILGWIKEADQEWLENDVIIQFIDMLQEYLNRPKGYTW
jgi:hypothetical protein